MCQAVKLSCPDHAGFIYPLDAAVKNTLLINPLEQGTPENPSMNLNSSAEFGTLQIQSQITDDISGPTCADAFLSLCDSVLESPGFENQYSSAGSTNHHETLKYFPELKGDEELEVTTVQVDGSSKINEVTGYHEDETWNYTSHEFAVPTQSTSAELYDRDVPRPTSVMSNHPMNVGLHDQNGIHVYDSSQDFSSQSQNLA